VENSGLLEAHCVVRPKTLQCNKFLVRSLPRYMTIYSLLRKLCHSPAALDDITFSVVNKLSCTLTRNCITNTVILDSLMLRVYYPLQHFNIYWYLLLIDGKCLRSTSSLTLNKIMDHSNTALWTIPSFELGQFLPFLLWNSKFSCNIYKQYRPWSEGSCRSPLIWVWTVWKYNMDSLQQATRLKRLTKKR